MKGRKAKGSGRTPASQWVTIRVTPEEKNRVAAQAELASLSISEYLRRRFFGGRPIIARTDLAMISSLRQLGGLLKSHFDLLRKVGASQEIMQLMESTLYQLKSAAEQVGRSDSQKGP